MITKTLARQRLQAVIIGDAYGDRPANPCSRPRGSDGAVRQGDWPKESGRTRLAMLPFGVMSVEPVALACAKQEIQHQLVEFFVAPAPLR